MRRFLVGFLATVGALALVIGVVGVVTVGWLIGEFDTPEPLPDSITLVLDIRGSVDEAPAFEPLAALLPERAALGLLDYVDAIDRAAIDPRVTTLVADLSSSSLGVAQTQEMRAAIFRFRAAGKTAIAFADSYEGDGIGAYYLASAFDRIWLQPSGLLELPGVSIEIPLLRGLLEEIGVTAEFEQRYEYKGAMAPLTERALPPAVRDNLTQVAESLYGQVVTGVASTRGLGGSAVVAMIDQSPLLADAAKANGLVDALGYRDDVLAEAGDAEPVSAGRYLASAGHPYTEGTRIALIHLDGSIERGDASPLGAGGGVTSGYFSRVIEDVSNDPEVAAVILRISSPGGSYVASDTIREQVRRLAATGTPVIASFADIAASGGYFAALPADHILALPGSLTGSIGAVGGKISGAALLDKLDISVGRIEIGANAGMFSSSRPFTDPQRRRLKRLLDAIYADFADAVAEARRLGGNEIDAVARGRVWTGEDAHRVGLVDALGGYQEALQLARQSIGLAPGAPIERVRYPRALDSLDALLDAVAEGEIGVVLTSLQSLTRYTQWIGRLTAHAEGGLIRSEAQPVSGVSR
ncbi:MAG: S49 family peptidase [Alphaproteobacteria bacterium]|nr:S49 family peptidase [Alphaproteobacteria bacterium]